MATAISIPKNIPNKMLNLFPDGIFTRQKGMLKLVGTNKQVFVPQITDGNVITFTNSATNIPDIVKIQQPDGTFFLRLRGSNTNLLIRTPTGIIGPSFRDIDGTLDITSNHLRSNVIHRADGTQRFVRGVITLSDRLDPPAPGVKTRKTTSKRKPNKDGGNAGKDTGKMLQLFFLFVLVFIFGYAIYWYTVRQRKTLEVVERFDG